MTHFEKGEKMPRTYSSDIELDHEVAFVMNMHKGFENAIGRWDLVRRIFGADAALSDTENDGNMYDRQVRDSLERCRSQGQHFCNLGNGKGYYVASTRAEYEKFKNYYIGAALRKLEVARMMDETADKRFGKVGKNVAAGQMFMEMAQ